MRSTQQSQQEYHQTKSAFCNGCGCTSDVIHDHFSERKQRWYQLCPECFEDRHPEMDTQEMPSTKSGFSELVGAIAVLVFGLFVVFLLFAAMFGDAF